MTENLKEDIPDNDELSRKILKHASGLSVPQTLSKEDAYRKLKNILGSAAGKALQIPSRRRLKPWIWQAAASLLIIAGVWTLLVRMNSTHISVPKGEHNVFRLPDGSVVTINAESEISYDQKNFSEKRFLKLQGEAFFQVKKGRNFVVRTKYGHIRVLGTSFNIRARENIFKVSCLTGKVEVRNESGSVILTPGESAILKDHNLSEFKDKNISANSEWITGDFYFENTPLELVFKEIERQFNVNFTLPDIKNQYYTGGFSNRNLVDALDVVCIPMELKYEIGSNSKIRVWKKPD